MSDFGKMYIFDDSYLRTISAKIMADERIPKDNVEAILQHFVYLAAVDYPNSWFTEEQAKRTISEMGYDPTMVGMYLTNLQVTEKLRREHFRRQPYGCVFYCRMEKRAEIDYEKKLNAPREPEPETQDVSQTLEDLQRKVVNPEERVFLDETVNCLRAKAFRAAIVMGWNLAYDHLRRWILRKHLSAFNAELAKVLHRGLSAYDPVAKIEGFPHKESLVLETCYKAGLLQTVTRRKCSTSAWTTATASPIQAPYKPTRQSRLDTFPNFWSMFCWTRGFPSNCSGRISTTSPSTGCRFPRTGAVAEHCSPHLRKLPLRLFLPLPLRPRPLLERHARMA